MAGRRRRELRPDERRIWEIITRSVAPLPGRARRLEEKAQTSGPDTPSPASAAPVRDAVPVAAARAVAPVVPPVMQMARRERRAIVRGSVTIEARLDLHGMRQAEAIRALREFLHRSYMAGRRTVLVVTGKGSTRLHEEERGVWWHERGVLRRLTPLILESPELRHIVLGFEPADQRHGGEGALYVRLRRRS
ncbi:Smr/MutS family protein [Camelimonas abortus]|uniref:Smr/MutS family protein n=1 Tax=Camelimonas abortus TaxID=1017184 RepID=A0ABV7LCQ6_9HYPH